MGRGELHRFEHAPTSCTGLCLLPPQSRSQSFVPLDQRSENESSGSIRFKISIVNNRILVIRFTAQSQTASMACYGACLKRLLPELSFSNRWSRGTKLWERDCCHQGSDAGTERDDCFTVEH